MGSAESIDSGLVGQICQELQLVPKDGARIPLELQQEPKAGARNPRNLSDLRGGGSNRAAFRPGEAL